MKKIVITIELREPIAKVEQEHVLKSVVGFVADGTFKESMQDAIGCASCQDALDIRKIHVELST